MFHHSDEIAFFLSRKLGIPPKAIFFTSQLKEIQRTCFELLKQDRSVLMYQLLNVTKSEFDGNNCGSIVLGEL